MIREHGLLSGPVCFIPSGICFRPGIRLPQVRCGAGARFFILYISGNLQHRHRLSAKLVIPRGQSRGAHAVGNQDDPLRPEGPEGKTDHGGMHVNPVGNELRGDSVRGVIPTLPAGFAAAHLRIRR